MCIHRDVDSAFQNCQHRENTSAKTAVAELMPGGRRRRRPPIQETSQKQFWSEVGS